MSAARLRLGRSARIEPYGTRSVSKRRQEHMASLSDLMVVTAEILSSPGATTDLRIGLHTHHRREDYPFSDVWTT